MGDRRVMSAKLSVKRGVTPEDDAAIVALDNVSVVTAVVVVAQTRAPVIDAKGSDASDPRSICDLMRFAPTEFGHFAKPHPAQKVARVRSGDDGGMLGETCAAFAYRCDRNAHVTKE